MVVLAAKKYVAGQQGLVASWSKRLSSRIARRVTPVFRACRTSRKSRLPYVLVFSHSNEHGKIYSQQPPHPHLDVATINVNTFLCLDE